MGRLIPAGTGVAKYGNAAIETDEPEGPSSGFSEAVEA
jgi:hypothetical protein